MRSHPVISPSFLFSFVRLSAPALECSLSFLDLFVPKRAGMYMSLLSELNEKLTDNIRTGHVDKDKSVRRKRNQRGHQRNGRKVSELLT